MMEQTQWYWSAHGETATLTLNICQLAQTIHLLDCMNAMWQAKGGGMLESSFSGTSQNIPQNHKSYTQIWFCLVPYSGLWKWPKLESWSKMQALVLSIIEKSVEDNLANLFLCKILL